MSATLVLRSLTGGTANTTKNAPLTNAEMDQNLINLDNEIDGKAPLTGAGTSGNWPINVTGSASYVGYQSLPSVNVAYSQSSVLRTDTPGSAAYIYAPVLHMAATDTMWQMQVNHGYTIGTMQFRQGYAGTWGSWQTVLTESNAPYVGASNQDWINTLRDFTAGTLITTSIDYSVTDGDAWVLEIKGNSYDAIVPVDLTVQGYIYSNTIIQLGGVSKGTNITGMVAINNGGKLCFWFPRQGYWHGYSVRVYRAYTGRYENMVTSVTDAAQPTSAKLVNISSQIRQSVIRGTGGNVGIGTDPVTNVRTASFGYGTTSATYSFAAYTINGVAMLSVRDDGYVSLSNGQVNIDNVGNVLVATSTSFGSSYKFQVLGRAIFNDPTLVLRSIGNLSGSGIAYFSLQSSDGIERGWMGYGNGDSSMRVINSVGPLHLQSAGGQATLDNGGNLSVSSGFLQVAGGTSSAYFGNAEELITGAPAGSAAIRTDGGPLIIGISSTEVARFDTSGRMGINKIPNANLDYRESVDYINASTTAVASRTHIIAPGVSLTITLPASPINGDWVEIIDRSGTGTCVIARNGSLIMGIAEDFTIDLANFSAKFIYSLSLGSWVIA